MNQRTAGIAGITVAGLAAIGLLAPSAAAAPPPANLAPGLQCDSSTLRCSNNSDQSYRIDWIGTCIYSQAVVAPITVPEHTWIAPHETITLVEGVNNAYCPIEIADQPNPDTADPGGVAGAQFQDAVADSSHAPPPPAPWSGSGA